VDQATIITDAELIVTPIAVAATAVTLCELIANNIGIPELDMPILIRSEESNAKHCGSDFSARAGGRLLNRG
jgi:hypothetical protein